MRQPVVPRVPVRRAVLPVLVVVAVLCGLLVRAVPAGAGVSVRSVGSSSAAASTASTVPSSGDPAPTPTVATSTAKTDPSEDRIHLIITLLLACAAGMVLLTIVYWRRTRPMFPALEGLEQLGSRKGRARARGEQAAKPPTPGGPPADELYAEPHPELAEAAVPPVASPSSAEAADAVDAPVGPASRPPAAAGPARGVRPPAAAGRRRPPGAPPGVGAQPLRSDADG